MKNSLKDLKFWQKKRNELPIDDDPNADWLQMQSLLEEYMPVEDAGNGGSSLFKKIKTLPLIFLSFSAAAMVCVFSYTHFAKNNPERHSYNGKKYIKLRKNNLSEKDTSLTAEQVLRQDTIGLSMTKVETDSLSSKPYTLLKDSLNRVTSLYIPAFTSQINEYNYPAFIKESKRVLLADDIAVQNFQAPGKSIPNIDIADRKMPVGINNTSLINNGKNSSYVSRNKEAANISTKKVLDDNTVDPHTSGKAVASKNTSTETNGTRNFLIKSTPYKQIAAARFATKNINSRKSIDESIASGNSIVKGAAVKGLKNSNKPHKRTASDQFRAKTANSKNVVNKNTAYKNSFAKATFVKGLRNNNKPYKRTASVQFQAKNANSKNVANKNTAFKNNIVKGLPNNNKPYRNNLLALNTPKLVNGINNTLLLKNKKAGKRKTIVNNGREPGSLPASSKTRMASNGGNHNGSYPINSRHGRRGGPVNKQHVKTEAEEAQNEDALHNKATKKDAALLTQADKTFLQPDFIGTDNIKLPKFKEIDAFKKQRPVRFVNLEKQEEEKEISPRESFFLKMDWGVLAGFNSSGSFTPKNQNSNFYGSAPVDLFFGVFVSYNIDAKWAIYSQIKVLNPQSISFSYSHLNNGMVDSPKMPITSTRKIYSLDVPLQLSYNVNKYLSVMAGPLISIPVKQAGTNKLVTNGLKKDSAYYAAVTDTLNNTKYLQKINFGLSGGLKVQFRRLSFGAMWNKSLTGYKINSAFDTYSTKPGTFQFTIGWQLNKIKAR